MDLPDPTPQALRDAARRFDDRYAPSEATVRLVFDQWPQNEFLPHVLAKVVVLNRIYSTNVYAVQPMAERIVGLGIDASVERGEWGVVEAIAPLEVAGRTIRFYSFASKYCAWHRPQDYQIYDSNVERALWAYQRRTGFGEFGRAEMCRYEGFMRAVEAFRSHFDLQRAPRRHLDKFLWVVGGGGGG